MFCTTRREPYQHAKEVAENYVNQSKGVPGFPVTNVTKSYNPIYIELISKILDVNRLYHPDPKAFDEIKRYMESQEFENTVKVIQDFKKDHIIVIQSQKTTGEWTEKRVNFGTLIY